MFYLLGHDDIWSWLRVWHPFFNVWHLILYPVAWLDLHIKHCKILQTLFFLSLRHLSLTESISVRLHPEPVGAADPSGLLYEAVCPRNTLLYSVRGGRLFTKLHFCKADNFWGTVGDFRDLRMERMTNFPARYSECMTNRQRSWSIKRKLKWWKVL